MSYYFELLQLNINSLKTVYPFLQVGSIGKSVMGKDIKSFIECIITFSNNSLKEKCFNIFNENGIERLDDLLALTEEDIDSFSFPLVF